MDYEIDPVKLRVAEMLGDSFSLYSEDEIAELEAAFRTNDPEELRSCCVGAHFSPPFLEFRDAYPSSDAVNGGHLVHCAFTGYPLLLLFHREYARGSLRTTALDASPLGRFTRVAETAYHLPTAVAAGSHPAGRVRDSVPRLAVGSTSALSGCPMAAGSHPAGQVRDSVPRLAVGSTSALSGCSMAAGSHPAGQVRDSVPRLAVGSTSALSGCSMAAGSHPAGQVRDSVPRLAVGSTSALSGCSMADGSRPLLAGNVNLSVIRPNLASTRSVGLIASVFLSIRMRYRGSLCIACLLYISPCVSTLTRVIVPSRLIVQPLALSHSMACRS